uniref:Uncharacterized protein n=1 Tax=Setaria viridis TaxID=4556 RepID=A0A4V6DFY0_SETVI|nr:hypothetical protein SEVIR_1G371450v2 [Setaria viridis]
MGASRDLPRPHLRPPNSLSSSALPLPLLTFSSPLALITFRSVCVRHCDLASPHPCQPKLPFASYSPSPSPLLARYLPLLVAPLLSTLLQSTRRLATISLVPPHCSPVGPSLSLPTGGAPAAIVCLTRRTCSRRPSLPDVPGRPTAGIRRWLTATRGRRLRRGSSARPRRGETRIRRGES